MRRQNGITIIEMIITIVILGVALVGITQMISSGLRSSADTLTETRAVALAQSYLDEIFGKRFDDASNPRGIPPCRSNCTLESLFGPEDGLGGRPDNGEDDRVDFDDVDDYHGLYEGWGRLAPFNVLRDAEGMERAGYENFSVEISVRYLEVGAGGEEEFLGVDSDEILEEDQTDLNNAQDAKLITVTIRHPTNESGWPFSVYKANY
jgi:MSHA pilin protein MshD